MPLAGTEPRSYSPKRSDYIEQFRLIHRALKGGETGRDFVEIFGGRVCFACRLLNVEK
jgi:hypothetical protein